MKFDNVKLTLRGQQVTASGLIFSDYSVGIVNELDECTLTNYAGVELDWGLSDAEVENIVDAASDQALTDGEDCT